LLLLGVVFFEDLVLRGMTPSGPFDPGAAPSPPDYDDPKSWSALPERQDAADAFVPELPPIDQARAEADVVYVHPTSYVGPRWNGPVDEARLNADTDRVATRIQASAFNACCAVYAPRYRQANGTAFTHPSPDGQRALDLAYEDVRKAFRHFLAHREGNRPLLLASHSQGSVLAFRLLREEISGTPLRDRLVAAWLVGGPITEKAVAEGIRDIPPCDSPEQTGCIVGWNARSPGYVPGRFEFRTLSKDGMAEEPGPRLCVNPLSWRHDDVAVTAKQNRAAVFLDADPPLFGPGFASAECQRGTLVVTEIGDAPRDFMSSLLDRALGKGNFHPIEYQIFFADIRHNAAARLEAWRARRAKT
jgi:hypothetical protein